MYHEILPEFDTRKFPLFSPLNQIKFHIFRITKCLPDHLRFPCSSFDSSQLFPFQKILLHFYNVQDKNRILLQFQNL